MHLRRLDLGKLGYLLTTSALAWSLSALGANPSIVIENPGELRVQGGELHYQPLGASGQNFVDPRIFAIKPVGVPAVQIDDRSQEALREALYGKWIPHLDPEQARLKRGSCGKHFLQPCKAALLPAGAELPESKWDFVILAAKTCWFAPRSHWNLPDEIQLQLQRIKSECTSQKQGAYAWADRASQAKSQASWQEWFKSWKFQARSRAMDLASWISSWPIRESPQAEILSDQALQNQFIASLGQAKRRIYLATYNLSGRSFDRELTQAAQAGVDTALIFDLEFAFFEGKLGKILEMAKAGVRIYPIIPEQEGDQIRGHFHVKSYLIDNELYSGSFNLSEFSSQEGVSESAIRLSGSELAQASEPMFTYWMEMSCSRMMWIRPYLRDFCPGDLDCSSFLEQTARSCQKLDGAKGPRSWKLEAPGTQVIFSGKEATRELFNRLRNAQHSIQIQAPEVTYSPLLSFLDSLVKERPDLKVVIQVPERSISARITAQYPRVKFEGNSSFSHRKEIWIDNDTAMITSANLTHSGFRINSEVFIFHHFKSSKGTQ